MQQNIQIEKYKSKHENFKKLLIKELKSKSKKKPTKQLLKFRTTFQ